MLQGILRAHSWGKSAPLVAKSSLFGMALLGLTACGDVDKALTGPREDVRIGPSKSDIIADQTAQAAAQPVRLPSISTNANWTHRGGGPTHNAPHAALSSSPQEVFSTKIGAGDSRRNRIVAEPVVAGGLIYTMDSLNTVTAVNTAGTVVWTRNLTPSTEKPSQGGSGGLAFGNGTVFATSGFGELVALDSASGAEIWDQDLDAFGGASPTYFDGLVYVVGQDSVAWAINADTGRIQWQLVGTPSGNNLLGGPGVAVSDTLAVFPFPSAELIGTFRKGGVRLWNAAILGRRGGTAVGGITDIAGDPVIAGDTVYAGNTAGRTVALDLRTGERNWTANIGSYGTPVVAGTALYLVSDQNKLTRLDRATGAIAWQVDLPLFTANRDRRKKAIFAHYGPTLAGGLLWVASTDGLIRAFDPASGAKVAERAIKGGAASAPVVAGGTMYVVSKRGQLHAFR